MQPLEVLLILIILGRIWYFGCWFKIDIVNHLKKIVKIEVEGNSKKLKEKKINEQNKFFKGKGLNWI